MTELSKDNTYFKPLTGVRAIAAFMVYVHHYNPIPIEYNDTAIYNFVQELHVGVTLFFVLSGFLIAYRYSDMSNFSFKKYMVNRVARIYPMYFILTTLTFLAYGLYKGVPGFNDLGIYLLNISFLKGFFNEYKFSGISQGWSLTVEETFYLLAPLFFLLIKRSMLHLFSQAIICLAIGVSLVMIFSKIDFYGFFSSYEFMFNYTFFGRCSEFFIGILLAMVFKNDLLKIKFRHFTYLGILGIVLSIYLITLLKGDAESGIRHPSGKFINTFLLPLIGISIFYYGLLKEKTIISKILSSNLFVLLGKSSYIFYLIHMGIIVNMFNKITTNNLLIFIALNIASIILFKYIEEPLNIYLRKKFAKISPTKNKGLPKSEVEVIN